MKQTIIALLIACALCGCATNGTKEAQAKRLTSAPPMPRESIGLFLETEARKGPRGAPYTVLCNVNLRKLHNTSISVWHFPKTVFYAEQDGKFFPLRRIETHSGGISRPYSLGGNSVTLPRPPTAGKWRIFAIQEHSEIVYARHLESHPEKTPLVFIEDRETSGNVMWTKPLISNSIYVEFAEIDEGEMRSAERVIESLIEAEQYDPDFREPTEDPTRRIRQALKVPDCPERH